MPIGECVTTTTSACLLGNVGGSAVYTAMMIAHSSLPAAIKGRGALLLLNSGRTMREHSTTQPFHLSASHSSTRAEQCNKIELLPNQQLINDLILHTEAKYVCIVSA